MEEAGWRIASGRLKLVTIPTRSTGTTSFLYVQIKLPSLTLILGLMLHDDFLPRYLGQRAQALLAAARWRPWLLAIAMMSFRVLVAAEPLEPTSSSAKHWAWQPVNPPVLPGWRATSSASTGATAIDHFIRATLGERQLDLSPPADRRTLMRRLSFDLHGVPPDPDDVVEFVADPDPLAYERLVDRLLNSPRYGERWARHWLDIAHYADTHGFERDQRRDHAWRYRDWVVSALNADLPYDEFLRDQIAGDVLRPHDPAAVIAAGFLAAGPWDFVGQAETPSPVLKRQARADDLDDLVTQVITATCGVTIQCARCHDHKLDPISQREYYGLWAVFAGVKRGDRALPTRDTEKVYGVVAESPAVIHNLARGNPEEPGEVVSPGVIDCLSHAGLPAIQAPLDTDAQRRIAIANWITHPAHPLVRRVLVNRLWHHHFGLGLVDTPSDFGLGGGQPSHPELLDWLADELLRKNWSIKSLQRTICLSATYRQQSTMKVAVAAAAGADKKGHPAQEFDSTNRLLWRQNPRRLDAESLRDAVLAVSGNLNLQMYGPGYRDFQYQEEYAPVYTYTTPDRPELWRRTIYRFVVRTTPHAFLTRLDCPDPANLTPVRTSTTTALQSLALLNNDFMLRQAELFARRIEAEMPKTDLRQRVERSFWLAFGRSPEVEEREVAERLAAQHGLHVVCRFLLNASEFVHVD